MSERIDQAVLAGGEQIREAVALFLRKTSVLLVGGWVLQV